MVETRKSLPQVVLHVVPALLDDVLRRVLRQRRLVVSSCPTTERRSRPRQPRTFDLAIVSQDLPEDVRAERIIVLDDEGRATVARSTTAGDPSADDSDLSTLLTLIGDLLR